MAIDLTANEKTVIKAYKQDDYVGDNGYQSDFAAAWVDILGTNCGSLKGKAFSGTMSSLIKKDIMTSDGESCSLTVAGKKLAANI